VLKKLLPGQENFFELFEAAAYELESAAENFFHLVQNLNRLENYAKRIAEHEAAADEYARLSFDLLHKAFVTPFDRDDIHRLTRKLDDITDVINRATRRIVIYQFKSLPDQVAQIAELGLESIRAIKQALHHLKNMKYAEEIIRLCSLVSKCDSRSEAIMLEGVDKLFVEEQDVKYLLKAKEIFEYTTDIVHACRDLSDILKGIVLEYS